MSTVEVLRYKQRLDHLFSQIQTAAGDDLELQAHWARYLCVLVSGFLETAVREIFSNYAKNKARREIASFVESQLRGFQNPKMEKIIDVARSFSAQWESTLRAATEGEPKFAVDSIVANRHKIAHGESCGVSMARVQAYYRGALRVVELLESLCDDQQGEAQGT